VETVIGANPDGHYLYFVSDGQLIAGGPPVGIMGLYLWHDGQLSYIGSFPEINVANANSPRNVWSFIGTARPARITPDGQHLLFATSSDAGFVGRGGFSGYDHAGLRELYLYDASADRLVCASCNPTGRAATGAALIDVRDAAATSLNTSDSAHALSDDGRRVFFNSPEALVPEDTNGKPDAYEYDAQTATVHLLSTGKSTSPSYMIDATASGEDVDNNYDLYDARVGGGFPDPPAPTTGCAGESCLPAATPTPTTTTAGSRTYKGTGNTKAKLKRHHRNRCAHKSAHHTNKTKHTCTKRRAHRRAKRAGTHDERSGR
jgi:hypothetical protein